MQQDIYGLLGSALVLRQDFAEAAIFFYRAGQIEADVMYIAENLMTLSELTSFTDSISGDLNSENQEKNQFDGFRKRTDRKKNGKNFGAGS